MASQGKTGAQDWKSDDVLAWLIEQNMDALVPVFKENEVTGMDLVLMTEEELRSALGLSKLQAAKIKRLIATPEAAKERAHASKAREEVDAMAGQFAALGVVAGKSTPAVCASEEMTKCSSVRRGLPDGISHIQLDASAVARYTSSVQAITRLEAESVEQRLPACREKLGQVQQRVKLQATKLHELQEEYEKQEKEVEELQDGKWYPGKMIRGSGKREEKLEENKEKLGGWEKKVKACKNQLQELQAAQSNTEKELAGLTAKVAELEEARRFCASLLQSTFGGPTAGDARENALEREVDELGPKLSEVRRYKTVYSQALELIKGARKALDESSESLQHAAGMARADIVQDVFSPVPMMNGPGGIMIDVMKRKQMEQGKELAKRAADMAIKAREMVPDMPKVDIGKLKSLKNDMAVMDLVFDNMITDMIVKQKIEKALQQVQAAAADVRYAEHWLDGWLKGRIDQDLRGLEGQLAAKRTALHDVRVELLNKWIQDKGQAAPGAAAPAFPVVQPAQNQAYGYFY